MNSVKATSELNVVENEKSVNIENVCYARVSCGRKKFSRTLQSDIILTHEVGETERGRKKFLAAAVVRC